MALPLTVQTEIDLDTRCPNLPQRKMASFQGTDDPQIEVAHHIQTVCLEARKDLAKMIMHPATPVASRFTTRTTLPTPDVAVAGLMKI